MRVLPNEGGLAPFTLNGSLFTRRRQIFDSFSLPLRRVLSDPSVTGLLDMGWTILNGLSQFGFH